MFNKNQNPDQTSNSPRKKWLARFLVSCAALGTGVVLIGALIVILAMTLIYPKLPPMDQLTDYHPKMPLRIYTADHVLMGEFGEERRNLVRINKIPDIMKKAVLAIEDDRFYQHSGVDYIGILRAALHNLVSNNRQGASTITQQVARNFFLTSEQTFKRKLYEVLLAWKIERTLTKDQILEIYLNQIYLGQRAFGFASAAQVYFGKPLQDITLAEAAMLAGLPKAPSANNPITNPTRAKQRQQYILLRMKQLGYVTDQEYREGQRRRDQSKNKPQRIQRTCTICGRNGPYDGIRSIQGRNLHTRVECLYNHYTKRPGSRLSGCPARSNGLRQTSWIPRSGRIYGNPGSQGRHR